MEFINEIEKQLDLKSEKQILPIQAGDVERTWVDVSDLTRDFGYKPDASIGLGVKRFIEWFKGYYLSDY